MISIEDAKETRRMLRKAPPNTGGGPPSAGTGSAHTIWKKVPIKTGGEAYRKVNPNKDMPGAGGKQAQPKQGAGKTGVATVLKPSLGGLKPSLATAPPPPAIRQAGAPKPAGAKPSELSPEEAAIEVKTRLESLSHNSKQLAEASGKARKPKEHAAAATAHAAHAKDISNAIAITQGWDQARGTTGGAVSKQLHGLLEHHKEAADLHTQLGDKATSRVDRRLASDKLKRLSTKLGGLAEGPKILAGQKDMPLPGKWEIPDGQPQTIEQKQAERAGRGTLGAVPAAPGSRQEAVAGAQRQAGRSGTLAGGHAEPPAAAANAEPAPNVSRHGTEDVPARSAQPSKLVNDIGTAPTINAEAVGQGGPPKPPRERFQETVAQQHKEFDGQHPGVVHRTITGAIKDSRTAVTAAEGATPDQKRTLETAHGLGRRMARTAAQSLKQVKPASGESPEAFKRRHALATRIAAMATSILKVTGDAARTLSSPKRLTTGAGAHGEESIAEAGKKVAETVSSEAADKEEAQIQGRKDAVAQKQAGAEERASKQAASAAAKEAKGKERAEAKTAKEAERTAAKEGRAKTAAEKKKQSIEVKQTREKLRAEKEGKRAGASFKRKEAAAEKKQVAAKDREGRRVAQREVKRVVAEHRARKQGERAAAKQSRETARAEKKRSRAEAASQAKETRAKLRAEKEGARAGAAFKRKEAAATRKEEQAGKKRGAQFAHKEARAKLRAELGTKKPKASGKKEAPRREAAKQTRAKLRTEAADKKGKAARIEAEKNPDKAKRPARKKPEAPRE